MKISKIFYKAFFLIVISVIVTGQISAQVTPDPFVNGATVNPAPLPASGSSATVSVLFNFGNASQADVPLNVNNVINVSLSKLDVKNTFSVASNITTSGGDYFTFTYNSTTKTLTGTQKAIIPGLSGETVTFKNLLVSGSSDMSNPQNGLNVNVVFLRTYNSELGNDNTKAFTYTAAAGPLPIRLLSFTGTKETNKVQLNWQTSTEQNSKEFEVEFSDNATQWNSIGTVKAAGTSNVQRNYSLMHNSPMNGVNYYRLKQVDLDNNFTYSNVVAINFSISGLSISSIYPNPFVNQIKIDFSSDRSEVVTIHVNDNMGRIIKAINASVQKGVNTISLDNLSGLPSGIYNVEIKTSYSVFRYKLKK